MSKFRCAVLILISVFSGFCTWAQKGVGIISGNILERESGKPVPGATVSLIGLTDASKGQSMASEPGHSAEILPEKDYCDPKCIRSLCTAEQYLTGTWSQL